MSMLVYSVTNEGDLVEEMLREHGFEVFVGDGNLNYDILEECDALIPGKAFVTQEVLAHAPNLKIVSKFGVGVEKIDIDACTRKGIWVANTPKTNFVSVAEHTMTLMLNAVKRIYPITLRLRGEESDWKSAKSLLGTELNGRKLLLIGFGNIGRRVARMADAFEMQILVFDPYVKADSVPDYVTLVDSIEAGLKEADIVSIHVAGTADTRHLIGAEQFAIMKSSAIVINTTRGFVVDEVALIHALEEKEIAGAALDVFEKEPIRRDNPLLAMENVVVTSHSAGNTVEARIRGQIGVAENIIQCFAGRKPEFALNTI